MLNVWDNQETFPLKTEKQHKTFISQNNIY